MSAGPSHPAPSGVMRDREAVWARLWSQLVLSEGFWLGFLFTADLEFADELATRAGHVLRGRVLGVERHQVEAPEGLPALIPVLLGRRDTSVGLVWVVGAGGDPQPWFDAWWPLLARLNEQRETLREAVPRGLVLVGPPGLLPVARDAAPDLWSIRSLLLAYERAYVPVTAEPGLVREERTAYAPERAAALAELALQPPVEPSEALAEGIRGIGRHLRAGRPDLAVAQALDVLDRARSVDDRALAQAWLARAYEAKGDEAAAVRHAEQAMGARRPLGPAMFTSLLDIVLRSPDEQRARAAAEQRVALARRLVEEAENPASLRTLMRALGRLGDVALEAGDLATAERSYGEASDVARRLLERVGESPEALRDVSVSLSKVGEVALRRGDVAAAERAFVEGLGIGRRLLERVGELPEALRDVSVSLNWVGEVALRRGDVAAAVGAFAESLEIRRRLLERLGESPQSLRDLAAALERVAMVARARGDVQAARRAYEEAVALFERADAGEGERHGEIIEGMRRALAELSGDEDSTSP